MNRKTLDEDCHGRPAPAGLFLNAAYFAMEEKDSEEGKTLTRSISVRSDPVLRAIEAADVTALRVACRERYLTDEVRKDSRCLLRAVHRSVSPASTFCLCLLHLSCHTTRTELDSQTPHARHVFTFALPASTSSQSSDEMTEILLAAGFDPNAQDEDQRRLLWHAVSTKNLVTIRLLLLHGADVDNFNGVELSTALHLAVGLQSRTIACMLLNEFGANAKLRDDTPTKLSMVAIAVAAGRRAARVRHDYERSLRADKKEQNAWRVEYREDYKLATEGLKPKPRPDPAPKRKRCVSRVV